MHPIKKPLVLTALVLAIAALLAAPATFAFIACEDCEAPDNTRCAGNCNGVWVQMCADWYFYGCGSWSPTSPDLLDSIAPKPFFLLEESPHALAPISGREGCITPVIG